MTGILPVTVRRCCGTEFVSGPLVTVFSVRLSVCLFLCALFVGAEFDSTVTFDVLVAPPLKQDRCSVTD